MTDHSSASIRPPKNWQDFERNSQVLFRCFLNDLGVHRNGRSGQAQHGVDIVGRKNGKGDEWVGVQCKGKDINFGHQVTEAELREEVRKCLEFKPPISEFYLISTAMDDATIQKVARTITDEQTRSGRPLSVNVWGWGALEEEISRHPQAIRAFSPDSTPFTDEFHERHDRHDDELRNIGNQLTELLSRENLSISNLISKGDEINAVKEELDQALHAQIDAYRDLFLNGKAKTAITLLETFKQKNWEGSSDRIKFRVLTNIAAAKQRLSQQDMEESAGLFLEAIHYQPEDKVGLANVALAHLIKGENDKAVKAAQHALTVDPSNDNAGAYLIQAYLFDDSISDPYTLIGEDIRECASVKIAIINFYATKQDTRWIDEARQAVLQYPEEAHIIRFAAEAEYVSAVTEKGLVGGERPASVPDFEILNKSVNALQSLWNVALESETPYIDASLPHNLSLFHRFLSNEESARKVIQDAVQLFPNDANILKSHAHFLLEDGKAEEAIRFIDGLESDPEALLLLAEISQKTNSIEEALSTLKKIEQIGQISDKDRLLTAELRINCVLNHPDYTQAQIVAAIDKEINDLQDQFKTHPVYWIMHSQLHELSGDSALMNEALEKAYSLIDEEASFYTRYVLADRFECLEKHSLAATLLWDRVDTNRDSPPLRTLVYALFGDDERAKAHKLLYALPKEIFLKPFFLRNAFNLEVRRGDYSAAESALNKMLEQNPKNIEAHVNKVNLWLRIGDDEKIKQFLRNKPEDLQGSPEDFMTLAKMECRFGNPIEALEIGYRIQIENQHNPNLQMDYLGLMLAPDSETINLHSETIKEDFSFVIENESKETETFVIEKDASLRLLDSTISPEHQFAVSAYGLKQGDMFTDMHGENWKIILIKHKYLHLLHTQMNRFQRRFPEYDGFRKYNAIEEDPEKSLMPIRKDLKNRRETNERILREYHKTKSLPLEFIAQLTGCDVLELWHGLVSEGEDIIVCDGSHEERNIALNAAETHLQQGCVVDALTLHIIYVLELTDIIKATCGDIYMTESDFDVFRSRLDRAKVRGSKPQSVLVYQNGQIYREDISSEQLEGHINYCSKELEWIENNILSIIAESEHPIPEEAAKIRDIISYTFLDPILASQKEEKLFLCEDKAFRKFASAHFGIANTWLQPVLSTALQSKIITNKEYTLAICKLIEVRHTFTSIHSFDLVTSFHLDTNKFETLTRSLFNEDAEMRSHLDVMINFIELTWPSKERPELKHKQATSILLRRLFFGKWQRKYKDIDSEIILSQLFRLLLRPSLRLYIAQWMRGHFIKDYSKN